MKSKWTILVAFLIISISNVWAGSLAGLKVRELSLSDCKIQIKKLCGHEEGLDKILKCIKSHKKEIPDYCFKEETKIKF